MKSTFTANLFRLLLAALALLLASPLQAQSEDNETFSPRWVQLDPRSSPPALSGHAMAEFYGGNVILFGGRSANGSIQNETWKWNGRRWRELPIENPPGRYAHSMIFDTDSGRILLFGGRNSTGNFNDLWAYDGISWTEITPEGDLPEERYSAGFAWDSQRNVAVLYGGYNTWYLGDTWEFDGTAWTNVTPEEGGESENPPSCQGLLLAYDAASGNVIMFGGEVYPGRGGYINGDTYLWDGETWEKRSSGEQPDAGDDHSAAWDPLLQKIILLSGVVPQYDGSQLFFESKGDTWAWSWSSWEEADNDLPMTRADRRFFARGGHALAFSARTGGVILFGGYSREFGTLADTWVFHATRDDYPDKQRKAVRIATGSNHRGRLEERGDEDWFFIETEAAGTLLLKTTGNTPVRITLYDEQCNRLESAKPARGKSRTRLKFKDAEAGVYKIRISGKKKKTTGDYIFKTKLK